MLDDALDIAELAAELPPDAAAALEVDDAAELLEVPADEAPVQAERMGSAAALATPAPSIRSMFRRFMLLLRRTESKSELVTIGLQIYRGRLSTLRSEQNLSLLDGEVNMELDYGLVTIT